MSEREWDYKIRDSYVFPVESPSEEAVLNKAVRISTSREVFTRFDVANETRSEVDFSEYRDDSHEESEENDDSTVSNDEIYDLLDNEVLLAEQAGEYPRGTFAAYRDYEDLCALSIEVAEGTRDFDEEEKDFLLRMSGIFKVVEMEALYDELTSFALGLEADINRRDESPEVSDLEIINLVGEKFHESIESVSDSWYLFDEVVELIAAAYGVTAEDIFQMEKYIRDRFATLKGDNDSDYN